MNEKDFWFAVTVTAKPTASEALEVAFNNLNSLGTEIDSLRKSKDEDVRVVGYFDREIESEVVMRELDEALRIYGLPPENIVRVDAEEIENQDWLAEWKKHWKPTETDKFIVAPGWEDVGKTGKTVIRIEPNMAFGTGTHETTQLCLQAIETYFEQGMSFFDVGTGTGILSIAVSKISGGQHGGILACDVDSDSVKIAKENALLNHAEEIEFYEGSISDEVKEHDFVCANVTADIIIPILPLMVQKSKRVLVLSGILTEQENEVAVVLKKIGVSNQTTVNLGEWISIVITK